MTQADRVLVEELRLEVLRVLDGRPQPVVGTVLTEVVAQWLWHASGYKLAAVEEGLEIMAGGVRLHLRAADSA